MGISDVEAAYLAGFLDGDGGLYLSTWPLLAPQSCRVVLGFYNSHKPTIDRIIELVHRETNVRPSIRVLEARGRRREHYRASLYARPAILRLLLRCLPWLVVKRETAELVCRLLRGPDELKPSEIRDAIAEQRRAIRDTDRPGEPLNRAPVVADYAYLAGLTDAEGCFTARLHPNFLTRFEIHMTSRPAIERAAELIEAVLGRPIRTYRYERRSPQRPIFAISVWKRSDLLRLLPVLYPHLVTKKTEAALQYSIAEFPKQPVGRGHRAQYPDWLVAAVLALKAQKRPIFAKKETAE